MSLKLVAEELRFASLLLLLFFVFFINNAFLYFELNLFFFNRSTVKRLPFVVNYLVLCFRLRLQKCIICIAVCKFTV